jgi:hypothetical protein
MNSAAWFLSALALGLAVPAAPRGALAQERREEQRTTGQPIVFSFVLRRAGDKTLDPFGSTGRREVLQLMAQGSPLRGRFRRARMDRVGTDGWAVEGWYEIQGDVIRLYQSDAKGNATGRVEIGRYLERHICFADPEDGRPLAFEYLAPATGAHTAATPPPAPARPGEDGCAAAAPPVP